MIEPTGYTALDLVGFTDRGTYAANVNYVKNDLVHYGGSIWRILIDDTIGITPTEGPNYTIFMGEPTNLVERIIAPLEDNPATVAYTTGRQIIYNDYLYEVIQNIAVGDILIAYEDDPTNANIKLAPPVETQVLGHESRISALETGKADNSVVAPVESGTTASRSYAAGAHFIKNGAFCTAKTAIAQGETFTLNTNYTAGDIASAISAPPTYGNAVTLASGDRAPSSGFLHISAVPTSMDITLFRCTVGGRYVSMVGMNGVTCGTAVPIRANEMVTVVTTTGFENVTLVFFPLKM